MGQEYLEFKAGDKVVIKDDCPLWYRDYRNTIVASCVPNEDSLILPIGKILADNLKNVCFPTPRYTNQKKVGNDELVIFQPNGTKIGVKVREIKE